MTSDAFSAVMDCSSFDNLMKILLEDFQILKLKRDKLIRVVCCLPTAMEITNN